jgi:hypothetical protein
MAKTWLPESAKLPPRLRVSHRVRHRVYDASVPDTGSAVTLVGGKQHFFPRLSPRKGSKDLQKLTNLVVNFTES